MAQVALVTIQYPPTIGGLQAHIQGIVRLLKKNGHQVTVITSKPNPTMKMEGHDESDTQYLQAVSWLMDTPIISPIKIYRELQRINPDIVHVVYPFPISLETACMYAKLNQKKLICTYIDDIIVKFPYSLLISIYQGVVWKAWIKLFDAMTASSIDYAKEAKGLMTWKKPIYVLPPPTFNTQLDLDISQKIVAKKELGLEEYDKIVLFVGGLRKRLSYKRPDILLKAWAKIQRDITQNCILLIIGDGECKTYYKNLAQELGIKDQNLRFLGYVNRNVLTKCYLSGDIFVLPSEDNNEAFGITAVEGMLYGNAIVASDIPGLRGAIAKGKHISLVQPLNEQEIVEQLRYWLSRSLEEYAADNHVFVRVHYCDAVIQEEAKRCYADL